MSGTIPFAWFVMVILLSALTVWQNHRLFRKFRAKYPEVAAREIPWAFSYFAHPEKGNFFFRKQAVALLRNDEDLWRERRLFVCLCYISATVPLLGFVAMLLYAMLSS